MTTTLRVLTNGGTPPRAKNGKHGYTCPCHECKREKSAARAKVCECTKPVTYTDDETGDRRCLCGRIARNPPAARRDLPRAA